MPSQIESIRSTQYTPLYENEEQIKSMETTSIRYKTAFTFIQEVCK